MDRNLFTKKIYEQKEKNFEVIIVDNNSKDKTVIKAKKFPVKVIKIKNFLPGKAINLGIKKSNGKYIVCLSAHCIPENKDWLTKIIKGLNDKMLLEFTEDKNLLVTK